MSKLKAGDIVYAAYWVNNQLTVSKFEILKIENSIVIAEDINSYTVHRFNEDKIYKKQEEFKKSLIDNIGKDIEVVFKLLKDRGEYYE